MTIIILCFNSLLINFFDTTIPHFIICNQISPFSRFHYYVFSDLNLFTFLISGLDTGESGKGLALD